MMVLWQITQFLVLYNMFVLCEMLNDFNGDENINSLGDANESENLVLDSVYDTMKQNYEVKLRQNFEKLNLLSDIRNKRNVNEPMNINSMYKNHKFEIVNRKSPETFPLGFKHPPKILPLTDPYSLHRSDHYYDEDMG